jgi:excisionase family DNA binding protein
MKKSEPFSAAALSGQEQALIQTIANTLGELTSQAVVAWLTGMVSLNGHQPVPPSVTIPALLNQADEFLTAGDIAKILKISKALAYRMIQTKAIPSFSTGRTVRVRREDLAAFIQAHTVRTSQF